MRNALTFLVHFMFLSNWYTPSPSPHRLALVIIFESSLMPWTCSSKKFASRKSCRWASSEAVTWSARMDSFTLRSRARASSRAWIWLCIGKYLNFNLSNKQMTVHLDLHPTKLFLITIQTLWGRPFFEHNKRGEHIRGSRTVYGEYFFAYKLYERWGRTNQITWVCRKAEEKRRCWWKKERTPLQKCV